MTDEQAIRAAIDRWLAASKEGDSKTLASLLDDDMLFVVMGQPAFGKKAFFAGDPGKPFRFESQVEVQEIVVHGDWALSRLHLTIDTTPTEGATPMRFSGATMSVWRQGEDRQWRLWRDANMVAPA